MKELRRKYPCVTVTINLLKKPIRNPITVRWCFVFTHSDQHPAIWRYRIQRRNSHGVPPKYHFHAELMDAVVVLWTYDENSLSGIHRKE